MKKLLSFKNIPAYATVYTDLLKTLNLNPHSFAAAQLRELIAPAKDLEIIVRHQNAPKRKRT